MNWFFYDFTPHYPYISSAIKFLLFGTLGEWLGAVIRTRGNLKPFGLFSVLKKMVIWALLGLLIKWVFASFTLLVQAQSFNGLLPSRCGEVGSFYYAFAVSVTLNIFFSPLLMYLHRLMDNVADRTWRWQGMDVALKSILWFWLPAHTITFLLPSVYQIAFAAFLGICLGMILGFAAQKQTAGE